MALPRYLHLIPRTCEYVRFKDKGELRLWMELICWSTDLKIGRLLWFIWVGPVSPQGSSKVEEGIERENQRDGSMRRTQQLWWWRNGVRGQGMWAKLKAGKDKEMDSPLETPESNRAQPPSWFCPQWDLCWTSNLQSCKIIIYKDK